ncbi:hypothetical protein ACWCXB_25735 [Streptomyces sp. NPDC001514]
MNRSTRSIGVFCGARGNVGPHHLAQAREFDAALASRGATLVYGGGSTGSMGAVATSAFAARGIRHRGVACPPLRP